MGERSSLSIKCLSCAERGLPQYRPRRLWPSTIERGPQRGRTLHCMARAPIASRFGNEQTAPHPDGDRRRQASVGDQLSPRDVSAFFGSQDQNGVGDVPGMAKSAPGASGTRSASPRPRKCMKESRSLTRYSQRSSKSRAWPAAAGSCTSAHDQRQASRPPSRQHAAQPAPTPAGTARNSPAPRSVRGHHPWLITPAAAPPHRRNHPAESSPAPRAAARQ